MSDRSHVTVIGDLVEDVVVWTSRPPRAGTDNPATVRRSRGGSGANVAVAVAVAGAPARFVGRVGDDALGHMLEQDLVRAGVDTRLQRRGRTGCVVVLVDGSGERTMFPDRAAAAELGAIDDVVLAGTDVVHLPLYGFLEPASAEHVRSAAARVRAAGGRVTIDLSASSAVEHLGPAAVAALVHELSPAVVFANVDEAATAGLASFAPPRGGCFVIKAGARPATIVHDDGRREVVAPAPIADVRDTTGAGDAFAGTFIAHWARGASPGEACAAGHRAAAATLGTAGAPSGVPNRGGST
jgi:sugar/nucleoside kinase (ribokinase family)